MAESETPAPETPNPEAQAPEDHELPLPPATFEFLVLSIKMQAEMSLGLFHFGEEKDRPKPNVSAARHAIDLLGVLLDKTQGNLSLEEKRLLENSLTELRFRWVEASKKA